MYLPSFVVVLPLLAAFLLSLFCYYHLDPARRLLNRHFLTAAAAILAMVVFVLARALVPGETLLAPGFLLVALCLLGYAIRLFRQFRDPAAKSGHTLPTG